MSTEVGKTFLKKCGYLPPHNGTVGISACWLDYGLSSLRQCPRVCRAVSKRLSACRLFQTPCIIFEMLCINITRNVLGKHKWRAS